MRLKKEEYSDETDLKRAGKEMENVFKKRWKVEVRREKRKDAEMEKDGGRRGQRGDKTNINRKDKSQTWEDSHRDG